MQRPPTQVSPLGDLLCQAAQDFPDRLALVLPNQSASYAQLLDGATRVARSLVAMGVEPGNHVGILIPNCVEYAEALLGAALIGAVAVPLNARHRSTEIGYIVRNARLQVLLTSSHLDDPVDFLSIIKEALGEKPDGLHSTALVRGAGSTDVLSADDFSALAEQVPIETIELLRTRVRVRDPALMIYTSGTTANPKGCVLTHEALTRGPVERAKHRLSSDPKDIAWGSGPLFHIGTLAPFIGSVGVAGTFLTDTYFEPGRALQLMYEHGATLAWPWFAAIVQGLIQHPTFDPAKLPKLRYLFIIAPPTLVDEVQKLLPSTEVIQACGMTETAGVFALCDPDESTESRSTTQGKPAAGVEVRIVDPETGVDQPDGVMGEILVRGYNVMEGYWDAPEKTQETLTPDRWLKTGDLYTRLANGSLVFGGRCKDMLKVGGENVAAVEIETHLSTHPAVKVAEVVGRPDARLDEVPVAFVELHEGFALEAEALIAHCRNIIASYKVPRAIYFMQPSDWPMSATKIDKRVLRDRLKELQSPDV